MHACMHSLWAVYVLAVRVSGGVDRYHVLLGIKERQLVARRTRDSEVEPGPNALKKGPVCQTPGADRTDREKGA